MTPEQRDPAILLDLHQVGCELAGFIEGRTWELFQTESMFRRAVEQCVWQMGRLASRLSVSLRESNPEAPWEDAIRASERLLGKKPVMSDRTTWHVATKVMPRLVAVVRRLVPAQPGGQPKSLVTDDGRTLA